MHSLIADTTDPSEIMESVGGRLRQTYVARTPEARMEAMRGLWEDAETPVQRHARHILTASAAARMVPSEALAGDTEARSEEHTSELQSLMRISYAVYCLKKKKYTACHQITI